MSRLPLKPHANMIMTMINGITVHATSSGVLCVKFEIAGWSHVLRRCATIEYSSTPTISTKKKMQTA